MDHPGRYQISGNKLINIVIKLVEVKNNVEFAAIKKKEVEHGSFVNFAMFYCIKVSVLSDITLQNYIACLKKIIIWIMEYYININLKMILIDKINIV